MRASRTLPGKVVWMELHTKPHPLNIYDQNGGYGEFLPLLTFKAPQQQLTSLLFQYMRWRPSCNGVGDLVLLRVK